MTTSRQWLDENYEGALLADGYDDAIVGVVNRCGQPTIVIYDAWKCIEILMERDGMTAEEADEYFSFNTEGSWVGEGTPGFMWRLPPPDTPDE